jgi:hypothetical protein
METVEASSKSIEIAVMEAGGLRCARALARAAWRLPGWPLHCKHAVSTRTPHASTNTRHPARPHRIVPDEELDVLVAEVEADKAAADAAKRRGGGGGGGGDAAQPAAT